MLLNQAAQAPVIFEVDGVRLSVPKMTLDDWTEFGAIVDSEKEKKLTQNMDEPTRFRFLNFYNVLPTSLGDLQRITGTPHGMKAVINRCIPKGRIIARLAGEEWKDEPIRKLSKEEKKKQADELAAIASKILKYAKHGYIFTLAQKLADLFDEDAVVAQPNKEDNKDTEDDEDETEPKQEGRETPTDPQKPGELAE